MILIGKFSVFLSLKAVENYFSFKKPKFSIQLVVKDLILNVLKDLLSRCGEGYAINSPLRIKVPELELLLDFFNSSNPFPDRFDGTSTTNTDDGPKLVASAFTISNKVAVQVQFGSYNFNNKARLTFRLLKLQRLQPSAVRLLS